VTIFRHTAYSLSEQRDAAGVEFVTWEVDQPLAPPRRCNRCQCWLRRTRGLGDTLCSACTERARRVGDGVGDPHA
jgi:predicted amidophosphoribosyltransferase